MNAKEEFLKVIEYYKVLCAKLSFGDDSYWDDETEEYVMNDSNSGILKVGYTVSDFSSFLESIDRVYDSGYGGQELFGTIWCEGGYWMERGEYDGSEWWQVNKYPEIPDSLKS